MMGGCRSRLGILSKRENNNKKMILGDIVLAFQIGVPAWGFSAKVQKQGWAERRSWEICVFTQGFTARKKNDNRQILELIVFQQQEAIL